MRRRIIGALGVIGAALWLTAPSPVRASYGENFGSVHFNSGQPDFGTPPRRGVIPGQDSRPDGDQWNEANPIYTELSGERDEGRRERDQRERRVSHAQIAAAIAERDWNAALRLCGREAATLGWTGSLRDQSEVLTAALKQAPQNAASTNRLQAYFHALAFSNSGKKDWYEARTIFNRLYRDPSAGFLREHALYQLASSLYEGHEDDDALHAYERVLQEFPHAVKREAALIMVARCGLLRGGASQSHLSAARRALRQLAAEFPNSRFRRAALGLQARDAYINGDYGKAAEMYLTLDDVSSLNDVYEAMPSAAQERWRPRLLAAHLFRLERTKKYSEYIWSLHQVDHTMQSLTPDGARKFVQRLLDEPRLAAPYFYYRLYYTISAPPQKPQWAHYAGSPEMQRDEWEKYPKENAQFLKENTEEYEKDLKKRQKELTSLIRLAERIAARHHDALPLSVQVKLAEIHYQGGDYGAAVRWANAALQALGLQASGADRKAGKVSEEEIYARALYVRGATRHRQHQEAAAIADFETLLKRCPDSPLRSGAREELAILYEDTGDLASALRQYLALDYTQDIAYILDVRMPTAAVAAYVAANSRHGQQDLLRYTLGVRSLRDGDFSAARRNLQSVPRAKYRHFYQPGEALRFGLDSKPGPDPLTVINELMELKKRIAQTKTREARAMAEYDYASYHYKSGTLLFYNAALWRGERIWLFETYWNTRQEAKADVRAVERHMAAHESYAHALRLCLKVAHDYPRTKAEPLALYRAACAAARLASLNHCWGYPPRLEEKASNLMALLARRYPRHPLASHARKYAAVFAREGQARRDELRHEPLQAQNRRNILFPMASLSGSGS